MQRPEGESSLQLERTADDQQASSQRDQTSAARQRDLDQSKEEGSRGLSRGPQRDTPSRHPPMVGIHGLNAARGEALWDQPNFQMASPASIGPEGGQGGPDEPSYSSSLPPLPEAHFLTADDAILWSNVDLNLTDVFGSATWENLAGASDLTPFGWDPDF